MSSTPYMPYYPGDFKADTSDLTLAEKGAYHDLIDYLWVNGGTVKNDTNRLLAASGLAADWTISAPKKKQILSKILTYFDQKAGQISHSKITKLSDKAKKLSKIRAEAGRKGGQANGSNCLYPNHTNNTSVNKLTGADAPEVDEKEEAKKRLWKTAKDELKINGGVIGKAIKKFGEGVVASAIEETASKSPADPTSFFLGLLKANPKTGAQPSWQRIPFSDDKLVGWASQHGFPPPPMGKGWDEYRSILRSAVELRRSQQEQAA